MAKKNLLTLFLIGIFFIPCVSSAATLSMSPSQVTTEVGKRVTVSVIVSSVVPFNAVSSTLLFPTSLFTVESVSKTGSALDFWVTEPLINKTQGTVRFEGVALGGFQGKTGTIASVTLRAIKEGTGKSSFQSGQILANDGQGTDITENLIGTSFVIKAAEKVEEKPTVPTVPTPIKPTVEEIQQPLPTLSSPDIMLGTKYGEPAILGSSQYAEAQVLLTFVTRDGSKLFITSSADKDGSFTVLIPRSLKRGEYTVTAVMVKSDHTNSLPSNTITVAIGTLFSDLSWEELAVMGLLLLIILILIWRLLFCTRGGTPLGLKRKTREAQGVLRESFGIIRAGMKHSVRKNGKTDRVEQRWLTDLKRDVDDAESAISKEIKEIESL